MIKKLAILAHNGKTIILSDHVLDDYEPVCDHLFEFTNNQEVIELNASKKIALFEQNKKLHERHYHFVLPNSEPIFTLKQVQIRQNKLLLKQNELNLHSGTTLITGANGVGKTSLFKVMTKMIPYTGNFAYLNKEIAQISARKYLTQVAQIFQKASDQFLAVTVKDELELSKKDRNLFFTEKKLNEWLEKLGLADHLDQVVYSLSGGQQKKLQILLMLMTKHQVLLIDEPLSGLDHNSVKLVLELMRESQQKLHQTFFIISHQIDELAEFCDYRLILADQRLKYVER